MVDLPDTFNSIIYATVQPTNPANLDANLVYLIQRGDASPLILYPLQVVLANLQPTPTGGQVFTDDRAPIEWITNNMVHPVPFCRRSGGTAVKYNLRSHRPGADLLRASRSS